MKIEIDIENYPNFYLSVSCFILLASPLHHGVHIAWKQTKVPSLSNMTKPGLKNAVSKLASLDDGENVEYVFGLMK